MYLYMICPQLSKQYNEVDMNKNDNEKVFDLFVTAPQIYKITKCNIEMFRMIGMPFSQTDM